MGAILNPGCDKFRSICALEYIDKTGMIAIMDKYLNTDNCCLLVSRPRRFGKSYAAAMLCAYYGYGNDCRDLFQDRAIASLDAELRTMGTYNIIYLDLSWFKLAATDEQEKLDRRSARKSAQPEALDWIAFLKKRILSEIRSSYGPKGVTHDFQQTLENIVKATGRKFLWICDEWDLFFREEIPDKGATEHYLDLLRGLFKTSNGYTSRVFAGAYFTGILPMKKMKGESAISSFLNFTMLAPGELAPYVGFTKDEVHSLCQKHNISFEDMCEWYDGYHFYSSDTVFNPRSVMEAIRLHAFDSYWSQTASYEKLKTNIEMNFEGLRDAVLSLVSGSAVPIDGNRFDNDLSDIKSANEELVALTHLGYLAYDSHAKTVQIPNKEIRAEFIAALKDSSHAETAKMIRQADTLLDATWRGDEEAVALGIALAHQQSGEMRQYNSEARLSETIRLAYCTARDHYLVIYELPGGNGYADIVFIPKKGSDKPLMVIELKWDKPVTAALSQIKERNYPQELENYGGDILLVGITYRVKEKKHICKIEHVKK